MSAVASSAARQQLSLDLRPGEGTVGEVLQRIRRDSRNEDGTRDVALSGRPVRTIWERNPVPSGAVRGARALLGGSGADVVGCLTPGVGAAHREAAREPGGRDRRRSGRDARSPTPGPARAGDGRRRGPLGGPAGRRCEPAGPYRADRNDKRRMRRGARSRAHVGLAPATHRREPSAVACDPAHGLRPGGAGRVRSECRPVRGRRRGRAA